MNQRNADLLTESTVEVFEMFAFLCPIPLETDAHDNYADSENAAAFYGISFNGYTSGKLCISIPDPLTKVIAANMLGIEEEEEEDTKECIDATKELINVVCGNVLTRVYGEQPVFNLGTPFIVEDIIKEIQPSEYDDIVEIKLDVEDSIVTCIFASNKKAH